MWNKLRLPRVINKNLRKFLKPTSSQRSCSSSGSSCKMNSPSTAAPEKDYKISKCNDKEENNLLFPWKTENESANSGGIFGYIRTQINYYLLGGMRLDFIPAWDFHALRIYWSHEFVEGSEMAFATATNSIFGGLSNLKEPIIPIVKKEEVEVEGGPTISTIDENTTETPSSSNIKAHIDMNLIFEEELATFFLDAKTKVDEMGHNITYKLIESEFARISSCDLIVFCCRSQTELLKEMVSVPYPFFFGPAEMMSPYPLSIDQIKKGVKEEMSEMISNPIKYKRKINKDVNTSWKQKLRPLVDMMTVRVGVEFDAKEIFHINDKVSGALLQGSEEVVECKHLVILEASYNMSDKSLNDFIVVDIDDWRSGNKFWRKTLDTVNAQRKEDEED